MTSLDQNTPLSAERLSAIRDRERMATEGPWVRWTDQEQIPGWDGFFVVGDDVAEGEECNPTARVYIDSDAEFIAHARQDVPDLLAEVDRLRTPPPPGELRGLETMCAALHAATETDPVVKEVAWRTFALIRAHREQSTEVDRLKTALANEEATSNRLLHERDDMEKLLDTFAYTIAPEEVIGEHSSGNDPWANALDRLTAAADVDQLRTERDQARETAKHLAGALAKVGPAIEQAVGVLMDVAPEESAVPAHPDGGEPR